MTKWLGMLIRRERLGRNLSQEGLCRGICVVSYLSKIEQGKAEAGEDILRPLLERLGMAYETDPAFLARAGHTVETMYAELLAGREYAARFTQALADMEAELPRYMASPYMLDATLLRAGRGAGPDDAGPWRAAVDELGEFAPYMTNRQYALFLLVKLLAGQDRDGTAENLLRLDPCAYYTCQVGAQQYFAGQYMKAASTLERAYDLAAREGAVYIMCSAKAFLGNCYSDTGQKELMLETYAVERKLAEACDDSDQMVIIDYNIASTYLEWGMADEAYALLKDMDYDSSLYYHKLAIALEKLGRRSEALSALEAGFAALKREGDRAVHRGMMELVAYRLRHPDYRHDKVYAAQMEETFELLRREMSNGFVLFHVPYMLEVLEAQRRYRDAYRLLAEFSGMEHLLPH